MSAVSVLHHNEMIHFDIKPDNIMFDFDNNVKLVDFGFLFFYQEINFEDLTLIGTRSFIPPEHYMGIREYPYAHDMWCLGLVLYELLSYSNLFYNGSIKYEYLNTVFDVVGSPDLNKYPHYFEKYGAGPNIVLNKKNRIDEMIPYIASNHCRDLIKGLLNVDYRERITIDEALQNKFFSS